MRYSCFDATSGLYRVFEDDLQHPVNLDLPVPSMPAMINGIGAPAMDVGRALPRDAREVGTSWQALGVVVRCDGSAGGSLGDFNEMLESSAVRTVVAVVALGLGAYLFYRMTK